MVTAAAKATTTTTFVAQNPNAVNGIAGGAEVSADISLYNTCITRFVNVFCCASCCEFVFSTPSHAIICWARPGENSSVKVANNLVAT